MTDGCQVPPLTDAPPQSITPATHNIRMHARHSPQALLPA